MARKNSLSIHNLSDIGEFGLIHHLTDNIKLQNSSSIFGIGDDAAVLNYSDKKILVSTDILTEGIHFNLIYTPLKHLGYKAAVVNFSDIYAMNGHPKQLLVSVALSNKFSIEAVEELYSGIKLACEKYGVDLIGGDTSSSLTGLTICMTAIGEAEEAEIVYRHTAQKNDIICVSGDLGSAYLGVLLLEREKLVFETNPKEQPLFTGNNYILQRQLKPEARKDVIELLKNLDVKPTSMIDISDGLSSDLLHLCNNSKKGCKIFQDKIPIRPETRKMATEMNIEPIIAALNGGEDYELLFTININDYENLKGIPGISVIGHICDEEVGRVVITPDGQAIELIAEGWNAFKK